MMASTNMLQLFSMCYEAEEDSVNAKISRAYDADIGEPAPAVPSIPIAEMLAHSPGCSLALSAGEWVQRNGTNNQLQDFFISKLRWMSPAEDGFQQLSMVPVRRVCIFAFQRRPASPHDQYTLSRGRSTKTLDSPCTLRRASSARI